jgi:ABC-type transport system involved in multi-copper enzyme maturation permease subunit
MYFWKCWRDTRTRFILFLILVMGISVPFTIIAARPGGFANFERGGPPSDVAHLWSWVATAVLGGFVSLIAVLAGLMLAPSGIGEEYREQTLAFLFTRPRSRRYLAWACWSVGACELLAVVVAGVVASFAALTYVSGYVYTWRLLAATLPLFVGGTAVYSMSYLLTVLARSGEKAINYGMGIVLISLFLPVVEQYWRLPSSSFVAFMFAGCAWVTAPIKTFPSGELIFYLVLALAFPAIAQLILQRREV